MRAVTGAARAWSRWWLAPVPRARVAVLRTVLYLFVLLDMRLWVNDVVPHGFAPALYVPTFFPRLLHLPTPTPVLVNVLQVVLVVACLVAATGRLPRLAGWVAAAAFQWWLFIDMSYGKVDHDHFALLVALWVLPTVGTARFRDRTPSEAAGWALRAIQVGVVVTYIGSAGAKWVRSGSPITWANSAIFTLAILRRGTALGHLLLDYPLLLKVGQWGLITMEVLSPVVLFLRGRWLVLAAAFWMSFHLITFLMIGIHFLPTVVCWLAFAPLERLVPDRRPRAAVQDDPVPVRTG